MSRLCSLSESCRGAPRARCRLRPTSRQGACLLHRRPRARPCRGSLARKHHADRRQPLIPGQWGSVRWPRTPSPVGYIRPHATAVDATSARSIAPDHIFGRALAGHQRVDRARAGLGPRAVQVGGERRPCPPDGEHLRSGSVFARPWGPSPLFAERPKPAVHRLQPAIIRAELPLTRLPAPPL